MQILSPRLRRLDGALAGLAEDGWDAMYLSTLDGFVAGIILCPEPIAPAEWLPLVWNGEQGSAPFEDELDSKWFSALVTSHADSIVRALGRGAGRYKPFLEMDVARGEVLWELWMEGFAAAMELRPDRWMELAAQAGEVAEAIAGMTTLIEIAWDESDLERDRIDALTESAPDLIPLYVERLHVARPTVAGQAVPMVIVKAGRNDPCSCGSGKKHKRCCGRE